jgi:DNA-binding transcriptional ArsR family regulator
VLDEIYRLTYGQPYLTQLIGQSLLDRLNEQIFEEQVKREPRFDLDDLRAVLDSPQFYRDGNAYFNGVWSKAGNQVKGRHEIMRALVKGQATTQRLIELTGLSPSQMETALRALWRHDAIYCLNPGQGSVPVDIERYVITPTNEWDFRVELMRRWVAREYVGYRLTDKGDGA